LSTIKSFRIVAVRTILPRSPPAPRAKKPSVALARQLAVDLWRIRTSRLTPEQLVLEI
jgi:hypothetical protein